MKCETGCMRYDGDEAKHLPTCPYYPESLTKLNDDKIKELEQELKEAREVITDWIEWEDEQIKKDGAYVRPCINGLIKNAKAFLNKYAR